MEVAIPYTAAPALGSGLGLSLSMTQGCTIDTTFSRPTESAWRTWAETKALTAVKDFQLQTKYSQNTKAPVPMSQGPGVAASSLL